MPTNSIFNRPKFGASQSGFELVKQVLVYWVRKQSHFLVQCLCLNINLLYVLLLSIVNLPKPVAVLARLLVGKTRFKII